MCLCAGSERGALQPRGTHAADHTVIDEGGSSGGGGGGGSESCIGAVHSVPVSKCGKHFAGKGIHLGC